jgi:hypothetical protein
MKENRGLSRLANPLSFGETAWCANRVHKKNLNSGIHGTLQDRFGKIKLV